MKEKISILLFFASLIIFAQEKIDTIVIQEKGKLTIELDEKINNILSAKEKETCIISIPKTVKKDTNKANSSDPCAYQNQMNGFKIQIYYSKNRSDADKVKNEFERAYPNMSVQVAYFAPDYRVLVGDYFTKNSASPDIRRLKSKYNSSFAIPYKVLCRKAK